MPVNMQELKFKVIEYVRVRGPSLPVQISKHINSNILFAGAILAELVANKKIKISHAKIGGSPVYYFPGQEYRLNILYQHLHEKEKKAYDLLKEKKILRDKELEPWQRVALRDLRDFAHSLEINQEIFWKWYLLNENETQNLIKNYTFKEEVIEQPLQQPIKSQVIEKPKEIKIEQQKLLKEKIKALPKKRIKKTSKIYDNVKNYFGSKSINMLEEKLVKKNKEYEFILEVPSGVGKIKFFAVLRDKKKINEGDLSSAHNKAQLKKLPLMFLSNGELAKNAKLYLENNYLVFEKI